MREEWVPLWDSTELDRIFEPIRESLRKKFRTKKIDIYIYKNPKILIKQHSAHTSRQITGEGILPPKFMRKIRKEHFNLVFLCILHKKRDVHVLVKPTHNILENEAGLSEVTGKLGVGPKFLFSMDSPLGILIFEEFLSAKAGWKKLYESWPGIMKHKTIFAKCFGGLLGKLHRKGILYGEIFESHLFINFPEHECGLTDFGISRYADASEVDDELKKALDLLERKRFPLKDRAEFMKAYSRHKK